MLCLNGIACIKLIILALLLNQVIVGAALNDAALFQNHDAVGVLAGGQAVRDDERP